MSDTLFDPETLVGRYAMWFRHNPRCRWRVLGTSDDRVRLLWLDAGSGDYFLRESSAGSPEAERQDADRTELVSSGSDR